MQSSANKTFFLQIQVSLTNKLEKSVPPVTDNRGNIKWPGIELPNPVEQITRNATASTIAKNVVDSVRNLPEDYINTDN